MKKQKYKVTMYYAVNLQDSSGFMIKHETSKTQTVVTDCIEDSLKEMFKDDSPDRVKVEQI